jgi:hypothetical protein
MHELNADEKRLLELLLNDTPLSDAGVDCLAFRANNDDKFDLIEQLESEGYIRKDQDRYFVSVTALVQLQNARAEHILNNAEKLFAELRAHYKKAQREPLKVDVLAERVEIDSIDAREALSYMVEGTWWGSRSGSFFSDPDPNILPSETILRFESFSRVIEQLRSWQATRIRDRQQAMANALGHYSSLYIETDRVPSEALRQKPDWFEQLPERPRDLLVEIYDALKIGLRALPAMGVRAVIDVVCVELVGDKGSFENKLKLLKENRHISEIEYSFLSDAIDAGSASAHRGYVPNQEDIATLLDIAEHLLRAQYIFPGKVKKMKSNTPSRTSKKNKE